MGISINGIVSHESEKKAIEKLDNCFKLSNPNLTIEKEKQVPFEKLINRKREPNIIDVYSDSKGTLMIFSYQLFEKFSKWKLSELFNFDYFDVDETSMSHRFAQFRNGNDDICMNIWDKGSTKKIAGDNYLEIKDEDDIFHHSFTKLTDSYLSVPFNSIELNTQINRYKVIEKALIKQEFKHGIEKINKTRIEKTIVSNINDVKTNQSFWSKIKSVFK